MDRFNFATLSLAVISLALVAAKPDHEEPQRRFLDGVQQGQSLLLKDLGASYEIRILLGQEASLGHTVVEIGSDFVLLRDIAGIREIRIPIYSIKAIVTLNVKPDAD